MVYDNNKKLKLFPFSLDNYISLTTTYGLYDGTLNSSYNLKVLCITDGIYNDITVNSSK